jgi:hypothetical protein
MLGIIDICGIALKKKLIYEIHPSCIEVHPAHMLVNAAAGETPEPRTLNSYGR